MNYEQLMKLWERLEEVFPQLENEFPDKKRTIETSNEIPGVYFELRNFAYYSNTEGPYGRLSMILPDIKKEFWEKVVVPWLPEEVSWSAYEDTDQVHIYLPITETEYLKFRITLSNGNAGDLLFSHGGDAVMMGADGTWHIVKVKVNQGYSSVYFPGSGRG